MEGPVTAKLSDRIEVTLKPLNGLESVRADQIIASLSSPGGNTQAALIAAMQASFNPMVMQKIYAACAVRSRNGQPMELLKNDNEVRGFLAELTSAELNALVEAYNELETPPSGADLKNASSAPSSDR